MVKANRQKYNVRAMCSLLKISRNAYYYTKTEKKCDTEPENEIIRILCSSRDCYGTRKIKRALGGRRKGCPYDNPVAEATYSIFKAEFVAGSSFGLLKEPERTLNDYVLCYNNVRIHGSLGYLSPVAYRQSQNLPVR